MIGKSQLLIYYSSETGVDITSVDAIYKNVQNNKIKSLYLLSESFSFIKCNIKKYKEYDINKIITEENTHYLYNENILINGSFVNSNEIKQTDKIAKHSKKSLFINKMNEQNKLEKKQNINGYHMGMLFGLIYGFGGYSENKIVFTLYLSSLQTIKEKFITLEETILKLLSIIDVTSYRDIMIQDKDRLPMVRYEIMLNMKTNKIFSEVFKKYINSFQKKLNIYNFIENSDFANGFLDVFLDRSSKTGYKTRDSVIIRELFVLSSLFGFRPVIKKENLNYFLSFNELRENEIIFGTCYEKIMSVEKIKEECYDIIPIIKNDKNIFITGSKLFLDKRLIFENDFT